MHGKIDETTRSYKLSEPSFLLHDPRTISALQLDLLGFQGGRVQQIPEIVPSARFFSSPFLSNTLILFLVEYSKLSD
jgi:hypothetical protein